MKDTKEASFQRWRCELENRTGYIWRETYCDYRQDRAYEPAREAMRFISAVFASSFELAAALEWSAKAGAYVIRELYLNGDWILTDTGVNGISASTVNDKLHSYLELIGVIRDHGIAI